MTDWIKCSDRLPPQDCYVLVANYDGRPKVRMYFIQIAKRIGENWYDDHNGDWLELKYGIVKYWQPLPDVPKE